MALVVLGSVAVACLTLRAQSLRQQRDIERIHAVDRAASTLLEMAGAGLLADPVLPAPNDVTQRTLWRGEHLGREYVCERIRVRLPNAARDGLPPARAAMLAPEVELNEYTLSYAGRTFRRLENR